MVQCRGSRTWASRAWAAVQGGVGPLGVALVVSASPGATSVTAAAPVATFVVDSTADAVDATPGDGHCRTAAGTCTLRAAIQEANAHPGPDAIRLLGGTYRLSIPDGDTTVGEDLAATGDLDILDNLTVVGASAASTVIDGQGHVRLLEVLGAFQPRRRQPAQWPSRHLRAT